MNNEILENLNKEQKAAVMLTNQPLRIIAGAGSGKTNVLTKKIAYLIDTIGLEPQSIVAVTFTNKAANEMKQRVKNLVGNKANYVWISTFHSLCLRFLREEIKNIEGFNNSFSIIDTVDQDQILKDIYKEVEISKSELPFNLIKDFISKTKSEIFEIDYLNIDENELDEMEKTKVDILKRYQKVLIESKSLDFDDLLIYTKKCLEQNEQIKNKWKSRFKYFLIDEFQDTSKVQFEIIHMLSSENNITIVGDPDQTIYTWRGADISFIKDFEKWYPNCATIILNRNYRSTKNILKSSNCLISHNSNRIEKNLMTENDLGENIIYYEGTSQANEASWVVLQINKLLKNNADMKEIAILYRSNYYSRTIEEKLIEGNISYKMVNGQKFYERTEIKDVLSFLRCIYEPNDISLKRIINIPSRKLGTTTLEKLIAFAKQKNLTLWDSWKHFFDEIDLVKEKKQSLLSFINILEKYNKKTQSFESMSLILEQFLEEIGYLTMIKTSSTDIVDRYENVQSLLNSLKEFETNNPNKYINDYLDFISLETLQSDENKNGILLMTIHAAKGLEFENVFLIGLNEGVFPSSKVISQDDEDGYGDEMEEERRLAYVAFTRAKKRLFLSSSGEFKSYLSNNEKSFKIKVSRFVSEADIKVNQWIENSAQNVLNSSIHKQDIEYSPGDKVVHINFGEGIVVDIKGDSIIIEFKNKKIGVKQLLKNHKSIEKVN